MTKYYCDLCGREVKSVEEYVLPDLGDKEFKNIQGVVIRRTYVYMPTKMELCRECRSTIGSFVCLIKQIPAEMHIGKAIKTIKWEE